MLKAMAAPSAVNEHEDIMRRFSITKMLLPVVNSGLGITGVIVWRTASLGALQQVRWTWNTTFWMVMALLSLGGARLDVHATHPPPYGQEIGLVARFRGDHALGVRQRFGPRNDRWGFLLCHLVPNPRRHRYRLQHHRDHVHLFLDGIFLAIMAPLVYLLAGRSELFSGTEFTSSFLGSSLFLRVLDRLLHHPGL